MKKSVYLASLGCSRNLVDSEAMLAKLLENNFGVSNDLKKADVFVVNTCGFLQEARDEAFFVLDEIFKNKKKLSKVIVCGCMANLFSKEILQNYRVFSILSSGNAGKIIDAVNQAMVAVDELSYLQEDFSRVITDKSHLAYLKISEGCSKACSFCIIPKIKGPLTSRSESSVINEFKNLVSNNVFEINLIAQDLMDFGKDRKEKNALINLVKEILKTPRDFWLRLSYIYPDEITDEFINLINSDSRICKYLDIPLQHISDAILNKMRRKTCKQKIYALFDKLRKAIPDISLRVSFMVGFPKETEDEFNEILTFIEKFEIDHLAVFQYSNEKYAFSSNFDGQIPKKTKQDRFDVLTKKQYELVQKKNKKAIGRTYDAIIDGYHSQSGLLASARHQGQAYKVDSNILINDVSKISAFGKIHKVQITDASGYDLIGAPIED